MKRKFGLTEAAWLSGAAAWAIAVIVVWVSVAHYEFATSEASVRDATTSWPSNTSLELAKDRPSLFLFMHPRCSCTNATIRELNRMLVGGEISASKRPDVTVVVSLPSHASDKWRETATLKAASHLPQSRIVWDNDGAETSRFQVATSGFVMLYNQHEQQLFAGGVTISRGHEGASTGIDRLTSLLNQRSTTRLESTPVFGCQLCIEPTRQEKLRSCQVKYLDGNFVEVAK